MGRMTPEDAEYTARVIETLFEDLQELRNEWAAHGPPDSEVGSRTHIAGARVALLNLMDVAMESDLKGTALSDMPEPWDSDKWEWTETPALVRAIRHGMSALVRDLSTLRRGSSRGRELDVQRFRVAWETISSRLIQGEGATIIVQDGDGGDVSLKVHFEPPMRNPFRAENEGAELSYAQLLVGNMMAYAFKKGAEGE